MTTIVVRPKKTVDEKLDLLLDGVGLLLFIAMREFPGSPLVGQIKAWLNAVAPNGVVASATSPASSPAPSLPAP